ncbi:MAG: glutamate--tRNA ligase, partial [Gammaproteobacteria bacterium]|nr:glutamate--tRNA ligase [Gammaproteobacteria bacterium]
IKTSAPAYVAKELSWHMEQLGIDVSSGPSLVEVVKAQAERAKTLREMAEKSRYFYCDVEYNEEAVNKHLTADVIPPLKMLSEKLAGLADWNKDAIHGLINETAEVCGIKMGKLAQPLRVAVTGDTVSPSIDTTLVLLGKEKTLARLGRFVNE